METGKDLVDRLRRSLQNQESNTGSQSSSPRCIECNDEGYIVWEANGSRAAVECKCVTERRIHFRLPKRFRTASLLDFSKGIQNFALDWL
jgi:hypothetical protein